jgi:hypothetical protein
MSPILAIVEILRNIGSKEASNAAWAAAHEMALEATN